MVDIALDAVALGRDRQRYADLLDQAERQIAAWNERADHLRRAVDAFDHLLILAGDDPARDGGVRQVGGGAAEPSAAASATPPAAVSERPAPSAALEPPAPTPRPVPEGAPPTPAAPEPVDLPEAEAPRGTDALRLVFESDVDRTWTLAELIAALDSRGWLPTSRRPEEGVRISLKRLAERGGAMRTDDGRWRLAGADGPDPSGVEVPGVWPRAADPPSATAPAAHAAPASAQSGAEPAAPDAGPLPAPVGPAAGGTITGP